MEIKVNDEAVTVDEGTSISALLEIRQVTMPEMLTVQLNDEVVGQGAYGETILKEGDTVEFVFFMGGGR